MSCLLQERMNECVGGVSGWLVNGGSRSSLLGLILSTLDTQQLNL